MAFVGEREAVIDGTGRLTLPALYAELIELHPYATLLRPEVLALWPESEFMSRAEQLRERARTDGSQERAHRLFMSSASKINFDKQRRATIPESLRVRWGVGAGAQVQYVGVQDRVEVWPAEKWIEYMKEDAVA